MNPRPMVAVLSSILPQLLLLLLLLFPPSTPHPHPQSFFLLLHHFLSSSHAAALLPLSRKRKQSQAPSYDVTHKRIPTNPDSFRHLFHMKPSTFDWLCGLLEPLLDCRDPVDSPLNLPAEIRLGIGLFRLATGADYPQISARFGVSDADSKFCTKQLCRVLCTNYRFWVGFPSQPDLDSVSAGFETLTGLPNCCGIIGCTRFHSNQIATQIVVDSSSRILNVVAGFRGRKRDLQILKSSTLYDDIEKGALLNNPKKAVELNGVVIPQYLLGNGDYTLLPWLILPFLNPQPDSMEQYFNNAVCSVHGCWLKTVASLRNWGVLNMNKCVNDSYKNVVACIGACCILHNMLLMREDYSSFCHELDVDYDDGGMSMSGEMEMEMVDDDRAVAVRKALATMVKR